MLKGSIVALITPFNPDGSVNFEKLGELLEWHIAEGTDGILVLGTTGESTTMTHEEDDAYVIRVSDDGEGFDPKTVKIVDEKRTHIGLVSVRSRIQNAGGTVTIDSEPAKGTEVTVRIRKTPKKDSHEASSTNKTEYREESNGKQTDMEM